MSGAINVDSYNDFSVSSVLDKTVLNFASLSQNSNKFYIMELQEGIGGSYRIYTEYGRMGRTPRKQGRYFNSRFEAEMEYDKILRQKINKGYEEVELKDGYSPNVSVVKSNSNNIDVSKISNKILKFIGKIYKSTTDFLISSIETPLGKLSTNQVARGLRILEEIEEFIDGNKDFYNIERLSNDFYSVIPVIFGSKVDYKEFLIDDYYKLNDKKELLGLWVL